jgi:hypothetical protein
MNPDAVIERLETGDQGTFGRIWTRGLSLFTGEQPWRDNASNVSCVPPAPVAEPETYRVVWTFSPRFRRFMYLLLGTAPRSGIRKHPANLMGDRALGFRSHLNGCIALGERLGWLGGQKAILLSGPAVRRFESHMGHAPFLLEVRNG